jgi:hypothetical protein
METMKQLKPEPREPKVHTPKDIRDGIVPPCPMDKNATEMREWATTLAGAASGLSAKASELVGMTLRVDPYTFSKSHSTDEYVDANRWLARQVLASIKPETDAARVFLKEVRSDINLIESGVSLIAKLLKQVATTDSLKMESAETRFQTTVYFRGGMTHDQVRLAVAAFKADYTARPFFDNRKYAMLAAMLKELPPSIKEPFARDELDNLLTLEMKGQRDGKDLMPEWDDVVLKIAVRLRNATGEIKKSATPEASSLDYRGAVTCARSARSVRSIAALSSAFSDASSFEGLQGHRVPEYCGRPCLVASIVSRSLGEFGICAHILSAYLTHTGCSSLPFGVRLVGHCSWA